MSTRLRAKVRRCTTHPDSWIATAHAVGTSDMAVTCRLSWHEAMQAAYSQLQMLTRRQDTTPARVEAEE